MAAEWCVERGRTGTVKTFIGRAWEDELVGRGVFRSLKNGRKTERGFTERGPGLRLGQPALQIY